jgi:ATP-dependent Clp protease ATP-binding subunit ClpA
MVPLEEIHKAHPMLMGPFMQVFGEDRLVDLSRGEYADLGKTIIIAGTNLLQRKATPETSEINLRDCLLAPLTER